MRNPIRTAVPLALAMLVVGDSARAQLDYLDSGQWSFSQDCVMLGDLLATTLPYGLQLWNVADPAAPQLLGDYYAEGRKGWAVDRDGDLLAMSTSDGQLITLDVADPGTPLRLAAQEDLGPKPDLLFLRQGESRFCISASEGNPSLQIHDLSSGTRIDARGVLHLPGIPNALAARGDTLYVCARDFGLHVVDLGNPDAPLLLGSLPVPGGHSSVSVAGNLATLGSGLGGFHVIDVSDPTALDLLVSLSPAAGEHVDLKVCEVIQDADLLFAICEVAGALAYDLSTPGEPVLVAYDPRLDNVPATDPYYIFNEGVLADGRLYLAQWNGHVPGTVILDATAPGLDYLGRTSGFDYLRDLDAEGDVIYVCTGQMGIFAHTCDETGNLQPRGQLPVPKAWGVQARDGLVYVASTRDGLIVGDFSDPDAPLQRGSLDLGQARNLVLGGDVAYVADFSDGLCTVDIANPDDLHLLDCATLPGMESVNVAVAGALVATADRAVGMNLWDVGDPGNILHLGTLPTANQTLDVALSPDGLLAYVAVNEDLALVVDISDPTQPVVLQSFASGINNLDLEAGILHATRGGGGLQSFDQAASPTNPMLMGSYDTTHNALAPAAVAPVEGAYRVFVADYSGLVALELDLGTPVLLQHFALQATDAGVRVTIALAEALGAGQLALNVTGPAGERELVLSPTGDGFTWRALDTEPTAGLRHYRLRGRENTGEAWTLLREESLRIEGFAAAELAAHPNPFNPHTRLGFSLAAASKVELAIYDLAGRTVRRLAAGQLAMGEHALDWDGRDDAGRELPSGVYFARLRARAEDGATRSSDRKLTLLR